MNHVRCYRCKQDQLLDGRRWRCDCGGVLDLVEDGQPYSQEAYAAVTMGEGSTALVTVDVVNPLLKAKLEYASPTGSFKDRGAAALVAAAVDLGVGQVVADSSGNAGVAVAAYCARADISATVFVAASTSTKKLKQLLAFGAEVVTVDGTREDVAAAAQNRVEADQAFYASHVYNPIFLYGVSRIADEIEYQLGHRPDRLLLPAGNGTLVLGAVMGFARTGAVPPITAVQAQACAPLDAAFRTSDPVSPVVNEGTIAEGIAIADPARGQQIIDALRRCHGGVVTVTDKETLAAKSALTSLGFFVEATAAVTYAAARRTEIAEETVTVLCGSGLKSD